MSLPKGMSNNYMQFFFSLIFVSASKAHKKKCTSLPVLPPSNEQTSLFWLVFLMFWMIWRLAWVFNKKYNFKLHTASWCQNSVHRHLWWRPPARHWGWRLLVIWLCRAGRWHCKQSVLRQAILEKTSVLNMVSIFFFNLAISFNHQCVYLNRCDK